MERRDTMQFTKKNGKNGLPDVQGIGLDMGVKTLFEAFENFTKFWEGRFWKLHWKFDITEYLL